MPETRVQDPLRTRTRCGGEDPGGGGLHKHAVSYHFVLKEKVDKLEETQ